MNANADFGFGAGPFSLAVLNPAGGDPDQSFENFAGPVDDTVHAPVNYHGFAACTAGTFHRSAATIPPDCRHVLLLLRRDLSDALETLRTLKRTGKVVAISWKESGLQQVGGQLQMARSLSRFRKICAAADGCIATTSDLEPTYRAAGARAVDFIPTPYPVEDDRWDFSAPERSRAGIFIGTREFDVPSRNHIHALIAIRMVAGATGARVTIINPDGRKGRRLIENVAFPAGLARVVDRRLPYSEYLALLARHRIVFQLDQSAVPGQVAGDALLARVPCVGGNGAIDRLTHAATCGHGRDTPALLDVALKLLGDPSAYRHAIEVSQASAMSAVSFSMIAARLRAFFATIDRRRHE